MKFIEFNADMFNFTYHPETTPEYYLSTQVLDEQMLELMNRVDTEKDLDTLEYIRTLEEAHMRFCLGIISSTERRRVIEDKKKWFRERNGDNPFHANSMYDMFYEKINKGRW